MSRHLVFLVTRNIGGRYANGDLGELLIFTSPLSDGEIEKVEGYLAHKWGLDGDLPSDHSYKAGINDTYSFGVPLHVLADKSGSENDAQQDTNVSTQVCEECTGTGRIS